MLFGRPSVSGRGKLRVIDGVCYRKRRGRWVPIPEKWAGQVTHRQSIRRRRAKKGQGRKYKKKVQR